MTTPHRGPLIIVSGPSGSGKSTLIHRLLAEDGLPLRLSVSVTTRSIRPGECEGKDYFFRSDEEFRKGIAEGAFLEHAQVHQWFYGTPRSEVERYLEQGVGVLLDIDVQGAASVRKSCPGTVSIFIRPPSLEEVERRLRLRGSETDATIRIRVDTARKEMEHVGEYTHTVTNDDLDRAYTEFRTLIERQFRLSN
jgi:guanylate kinase